MSVMMWQDFLQFLTFIVALLNLTLIIWIFFRVTNIIETHGLLNSKSPFVKKKETSPSLPRYNGE